MMDIDKAFESFKNKYKSGIPSGKYNEFDVLYLCVGFTEALECIGEIDQDHSNRLIANTVMELFKENGEAMVKILLTEENK